VGQAHGGFFQSVLHNECPTLEENIGPADFAQLIVASQPDKYTWEFSSQRLVPETLGFLAEEVLQVGPFPLPPPTQYPPARHRGARRYAEREPNSRCGPPQRPRTASRGFTSAGSGRRPGKAGGLIREDGVDFRCSSAELPGPAAAEPPPSRFCPVRVVRRPRGRHERSPTEPAQRFPKTVDAPPPSPNEATPQLPRRDARPKPIEATLGVRRPYPRRAI